MIVKNFLEPVKVVNAENVALQFISKEANFTYAMQRQMNLKLKLDAVRIFKHSVWLICPPWTFELYFQLC